LISIAIAAREPAEIEEERERVAPTQQDHDAVQKLGVLRVEPVRVDRLGVVQAGDGMALGDLDREGHVVPEGVEVEDSAVECVFGGQAPVSKDERNYP
jgi:hypothetical protein